MAALRGILVGNRGSVSRLGSKNSGICSTLNTWDGEIFTRLDANGDFIVEVKAYDKGKSWSIFTGNVDTLEVQLTDPSKERKENQDHFGKEAKRNLFFANMK